MAPRQRIATPPSLEDVAAAARDSSGLSSTAQQHRPLLSNNSSTSASSSSDDDDDHSQADHHHPFPSKPSTSHLTVAQQQAEAADVAREQHDYFNLVALVRGWQ